MTKILVDVSEIIALASKALLRNGICQEDVTAIINHLLDGETSGHSSHGFFRIPGIVSAAKKVNETYDICVEQETSNSALLNGGNRQGLVVALKGMEIAINKAKGNRMAIVGGHKYVGTTGSMGYYTRQIADQGLIGFMVAGSAEGVSPWGSREMILGTNPISIGIPRKADPIVVDLATAKWSYGDLSLAMIEGRSIPEGIVLDKDGNPSTDPHDADYGSQLPMGDHKGYALGLAIEILAGPFVGAKAGVKAVTGSDGFTIMAVSPDLFVPKDIFESQVDALIDEIKNSKKRPGVMEIYYPGERSHLKRMQNQGQSQIEMLKEVFDSVKAIAVG